jgi:hypothetical protein
MGVECRVVSIPEVEDPGSLEAAYALSVVEEIIHFFS